MKRLLLILLLFPMMVSAQDGQRIHRHKHYDTTRVEDHQKYRRRRLTTDVDSTGIAMYAWDGECRLRIRLRTSKAESFYQETTINGQPAVKYGNDNVRFRMRIREDGSFEFDAIMLTKPANGQYFFPFDIQTKGLIFAYQRPLTQADNDDGFFRPDSVAGSYAIYHATQEWNRLDTAGGDTVYNMYENGKFSHIFRPRVWDAAGDTVWGYVEINAARTKMRIGVDSTWGDNAAKPLTFDPTFGNTNTPVSTTATGQNPAGFRFLTAGIGLGESGTLTSIHMHMGTDGASACYALMALYDADANGPANLIASGAAADSVDIGGANAWHTIDASAALTAEDMWIAGNLSQGCSESFVLSYDDLTTFKFFRNTSSPPAMPAWDDPETTTQHGNDNLKGGAYCTYTAAAGAVEASQVMQTIIR